MEASLEKQELSSTTDRLDHDISIKPPEEDVVVVSWQGLDDPADPFNWPLKKKWETVSLGLCVSFVSAINGTIITVAHEAINDEFGISDAAFPNSYWPTTSWGVGGALFPLMLFPLMEDFGVRPVVLGTNFIFVCFLIPVGLAPNFATLIAARFFTGGCVQLLCNAVASIITNVFEGELARTVPIGIFITTYFSGLSIGPVIGSAILQRLSWRWIGIIELIWTAALFPVFAILLPESRSSVLLKAKAKRLRTEGIKARTAEELDHHHLPWYQVVRKSVQRPLYMLLTEPVVIVATLWSVLILGTIYLFTQSVEQVYGELYGWSAVQAGYVQGAVVVGQILGCVFYTAMNPWYYRSASRNTEAPGTPIPEARLYASIAGGLLGVTGGMLVYAWTSYPSIHWIAPTIGLAMVGSGSTSVVVGIAHYAIDAYSKYAASALGAVGLVENIGVAFLPLAAPALYTNLGFQWASSLLAFVSLALVGTLLVVLKWGEQIRSRSPFMKEAVFERQRVGSRADSG